MMGLVMGKLLVVGSFCATIVTSMACDLVSEKIYATIIGSALVGFLSAHRMLKFNRHDPALLQRVSENVKAAQELLSESAYGQYRKETEGVTFSTNALGWSNLLDTLKHPLFIFTMFSTGVVMFLSPSFTEYS